MADAPAPATNGNGSSRPAMHPLTAGAMAGALTIIITWACNTYLHTQIPGEVGQAFTLLLGGLGAHYLGMQS